jgi:hypothetical protein
MVNNTSSAINFLVKAGILPPPHPSLPLPPPLRQYRVGPPPSRHGGVYSVVHSHAVRARVHLGVGVGRGWGGVPLALALKAPADVTVEHPRAHPGTDAAPDVADCRDRRDAAPGAARCATALWQR